MCDMWIDRTSTEIYSQLSRLYTEENTQIANESMQRCSIALVTMEMQIKAIMRHHYLPPEWLNLKQTNFLKLTTPHIGEIGSYWNSDTAGGNANW